MPTCEVHGDAARVACSRCGAFICATCRPDGLCPGCATLAADRTADERRATWFRTSVVALLCVTAVLFALPPVLAGALRVQKGSAPDLTLYLFAAIYAVPPLLAALLVRLLSKPWPTIVALPTTLLALVLSLLLGDVMGRAFIFASICAALAMLRAGQWSRWMRKRT